MILQAYDFLELSRRMDVKLQVRTSQSCLPQRAAAHASLLSCTEIDTVWGL